MFTGIVRALGAVRSLRKNGGGCELRVDISALDAEARAAEVGDSIAVNGVCLSVSELRDGCARFDISPETLARCLVGEWREGARVNLEPALAAGAPLGGHLVCGHIDGAGTLLARRDSDGCAWMRFEAPRELGRLIADKGSLAVDGVSLTTNDVRDENGATCFEVMLVPHTLKHTTLGALQPCARAHLEADALARYAQRLLAGGNDNGGDAR